MNRIASTLTLVGGVGVVVGGALSVRPAMATPTWRNAFQARYPASTLVARMETLETGGCLTCHTMGQRGDDGNCYREALKASILAHPTWNRDQHFQAVENLDSDGDGVSNIDEIMMPYLDGVNVGYNAGLVGDVGTDPCAADPSVAVSNMVETPPGDVCPCELDGNDAQVDVFDLLAYLDLWFAGDAGADIDGTAGVDVFDLLFFLDCWFPASAGAPCP